MNAHRVKIFNRADDDAVIRPITDHFHLELFPADERLFDQELVGGRGLNAPLTDGFKFFGVIRNAAARAAQSKAGPNHQRKTTAARELADLFLNRPGLFQRMGDARFCRVQANLGHGLFKLEPVFGFFDGLFFCADKLDAKLLKHALAM